MSNLVQASEGAARAADVLLRTTCGRAVLLRLPAPAISGDDSEQLGLATPQFQDIRIEPVGFRRTDSGVPVLLVSACALGAIVATLAFDSAAILFAAAVGVVIDDVLYKIESTRTSQTHGKPYCYCLTLRAPAR